MQSSFNLSPPFNLLHKIRQNNNSSNNVSSTFEKNRQFPITLQSASNNSVPDHLISTSPSLSNTNQNFISFNNSSNSETNSRNATSTASSSSAVSGNGMILSIQKNSAIPSSNSTTNSRNATSTASSSSAVSGNGMILSTQNNTAIPSSNSETNSRNATSTGSSSTAVSGNGMILSTQNTTVNDVSNSCCQNRDRERDRVLQAQISNLEARKIKTVKHDNLYDLFILFVHLLQAIYPKSLFPLLNHINCNAL